MSITYKYSLEYIGIGDLTFFCVEYPHVGLDQIKLFLENLNYKFDLTKDNNAYFIKL
jgi:hypothetical protein